MKVLVCVDRLHRGNDIFRISNDLVVNGNLESVVSDLYKYFLCRQATMISWYAIVLKSSRFIFSSLPRYFLCKRHSASCCVTLFNYVSPC